MPFFEGGSEGEKQKEEMQIQESGRIEVTGGWSGK